MERTEIFLSLLRCAVGDEASAPTLSCADWDRLLSQARFHHVESILYYAAKRCTDIPVSVMRELDAAHQSSIFRGIQQQYVAAQISNVLTQARVPHILLRGALLRNDYPFPDMRTMSDLDFLVHTEDYPKIKRAMDELEGQHIHTDGGHYSFTLPPQIHVEFHPNLIYTVSPVGTAINPGWQYARQDADSYEKRLSEDGFYLNMICHLAYHFASGGTGVRSILDIWIYCHRHRPQPNAEFVQKELERAGLSEFASNIETLAEAWFGSGHLPPELSELANYILNSGVYGTTRQAVLNAVCFSGSSTGFKTLFQKAFYSRDEMENRFPWLKNHPWLLPAAWCLRASRAVTRHGGYIRKWHQEATDLSKDEIARQRRRLIQFGLMKKASDQTS